MEKQLISSLTIQGAIVMVLVNIAERYDLRVGSEEITNVISALILLGGFAATIIGRIRANRNLKVGGKML